MEPLDLAPPGLTGWLEELDAGRPMVLANPRELRLKIVISAGRITAFALAEAPGAARELLLRLGFAPDQIRRMLCG